MIAVATNKFNRFQAFFCTFFAPVDPSSQFVLHSGRQLKVTDPV